MTHDVRKQAAQNGHNGRFFLCVVPGHGRQLGVKARCGLGSGNHFLIGSVA